ncbi:DegT/DnrJ/EryC1/StrS family aminotransferase [Metabacillus iocasae]|uniref:Perosamine synthetase n=1 Tax=Priestia iocasae TaxID=2291674 RepID=A0ABS2QW91_9BACI|nr:DegT/DnrJ/EryC1/StrS family aminotransferase [Metabacillus iocasae]MBM7703021.1 perosamine synthetase [Metabacillus iocasae]
MQIPLSKPDITNLEIQYVTDVLKSGNLSLGDKVRAFEQKFEEWLRISHAVAMNSGTSALHVAVKSLGLKPGDEVITSPYSFVASSNCLLFEGVKPVFVDVHPDTTVMNEDLIEAAITDKTKAILVVHIFGHPCNMEKIMDIANRYQLKVIEDACESIGATWNGQYTGTFGDISVFAFYPNKQMTTGEGGMLVTNNTHIYEMAKSLRNQGRSVKNEWLVHERLGYNYRLSDVHAAIGVAQMERIQDILTKREQAATRYHTLIQKHTVPVTHLQCHPAATISWFVYPILLPNQVNRDEVMAKLSEKGVQTKPYFPSIHLQSFYQDMLNTKTGDFPVSEMLAQRSLALPFFNNITMEEQTYVIETLLSILKEQGA